MTEKQNTNCDDCPMCIDDSDEGLYCALGYKINSYFKGWYYLHSGECQLESIKFEDQEFKPKSRGDN